MKTNAVGVLVNRNLFSWNLKRLWSYGVLMLYKQISLVVVQESPLNILKLHQKSTSTTIESRSCCKKMCISQEAENNKKVNRHNQIKIIKVPN